MKTDNKIVRISRWDLCTIARSVLKCYSTGKQPRNILEIDSQAMAALMHWL